MTPRERAIAAFRGEPAEGHPTQIDFTPLAAQQAAGWLGVEIRELPDVLGNHLMSISPREDFRIEGDTTFDAWGIGWDNTINDGFQVNVNPLADLGKLAAYRFPDPDDSRLYEGLSKAVRDNSGRRAVVGAIGFCLWERFYLLRGFERAMEDLAADPALVEDLLDRILGVQSGIARNLASLGIDIGYTGDDFGSQHGLLFSPETWRRFFKPRYQKLWAVYKDAGLPVGHHSCGDVRAILGEMVEIGLDVLNPVQTHAMPPEELADRWGDRIGFWGGICTQSVLPFGTPSEVKQFVKRCSATLGASGRWIAGPSHALTSDVPRQNFFALLDAMEIETGKPSG